MLAHGDKTKLKLESHLETLLAGLDGCDVTSNTATDDDEIVFLCCPVGRKSAITPGKHRAGLR